MDPRLLARHALLVDTVHLQSSAHPRIRASAAKAIWERVMVASTCERCDALLLSEMGALVSSVTIKCTHKRQRMQSRRASVAVAPSRGGQASKSRGPGPRRRDIRRWLSCYIEAQKP